MAQAPVVLMQLWPYSQIHSPSLPREKLWNDLYNVYVQDTALTRVLTQSLHLQEVNAVISSLLLMRKLRHGDEAQ